MKKSLLLLSLGLVALGTLPGCKGGGGSGSSDAVTLKFNFEPGSKFQYTMDTKQTISQTMMGMSMTINQDMIMESTYDVAAADGGNKKLTVTYDRMYMKTGTPMKTMEYDSKDPAKQAPELKSVGGMIGKPFSMTVTEKGEITSIEGLSDMLNGMIDTTDPNAAVAREQMAGMFNDTTIRSMMQQSMYIYPDKPVKPGDTWTRQTKMNMVMFAMTMDNTFKLISVNDGKAHIEMESKITGDAVNNPQMPGMTMELNGTQKGTMDLEVSTGMITDSKLKQEIKGKMSMDQGGQKIEVPMDIKSDIHITGQKK